MTERGPSEIPEAVFRQSPEYNELKEIATEARREKKEKAREARRSQGTLAWLVGVSTTVARYYWPLVVLGAVVVTMLLAFSGYLPL